MNNTKWIHWSVLFFVVLFFGAVVLSQIIPTAVQASENNVLTQTGIQELLAVQGAEYYAYMNMEYVSEELKSVIWEARMEIIFNNSWVADEINGRVLDEAGNVIEVLPHFSELFPDDWVVPRDPNQTYGIIIGQKHSTEVE